VDDGFFIHAVGKAVDEKGAVIAAPVSTQHQHRASRAGALVRRLLRKYSTDAVSDSAASLSYYLLFSLFPFLLFVAALIAYLPLQTPVEHFLDRVRPLVPAQPMLLVEAHLRQLISRPRPHLLTLGLAGSFWSASRGVDVVRRALDLAYDVNESRPLWKTELLAWGLTIVGGLLVLVAASALIAGGGVGVWIADKLGVRSAFLSVMHWLRWPVLGVTFMTVAGLAYRVLPDAEMRFVFIVPGAVIGALTWVLATWVFGLYVAAFEHYDVTYGSLGGVLILLTWLYLSAFITVAGGQLNAALERSSVAGKRAGARQPEGANHRRG
jgi:membrane protein